MKSINKPQEKESNKLCLKKIDIKGNVIGKFGTFNIEQTFKNETSKVLEVGYTFPIAETATIVGFEIFVGDNHIIGQCEEKKQAKTEYCKNMVKGNSAYLLEEKSDNTYKLNLGKIAKDEEVKVIIKITDKFDIVDNQINVFVPTLVAPKYNSQITSNLRYGKVDYTVDFNINISKNLYISDITSQTHAIDKIDLDDGSTNISILDYMPSSDFRLGVVLAEECVSTALISKTKNGKDITYLSFMPEINNYINENKKYIFMIDVSGSMYGDKIKQTKCAVLECLQHLEEGDKFNLIAFSDRLYKLDISAIDFNPQNYTKALEFINSLQADGGTELENPMKLALLTDKSKKDIILFTDGQIGYEDELLNFIEQNNKEKKTRIFPFGIDYDINTSFIRKLAKLTNGKAEFVTPEEDLYDKIVRTFARIQTPLIKNLRIDYGKNKLIDEIKEDENLFNFEYFNVFSAVEELVDDISLIGTFENEEYSWTIKPEEISNAPIDLELLYAKEEINRLQNYLIHNAKDEEEKTSYTNMIIEVAEKYNINSKFTSFLSVYERDNKIQAIPEYQETTLDNNDSYNYKKNCCNSSIRYKLHSFARPNIIDDFYEDFIDGDLSCMMPPITQSPYSKIRINDIIYWSLKTPSENIGLSIIKSLFKEEKSIYTYLLYAIYYLLDTYSKFNKDDFEQFVIENALKISENEIYMKLLARYVQATGNDLLACFISDKYNQEIEQNKEIKINIEKIPEEEFKKYIASCNKTIIREHIDDILAYIVL